jgi:DNA modification methylase
MIYQEGDIVMDCFMGIGATGIACKELERSFIGCEIDNNYFNIALRRIGK